MKKVVESMGGEVFFLVESSSESLEEEILEFAQQILLNLVDKFNFYNQNSLLSKLNQERKIEYDEDLAFVLEKSLEIQEISGGKFNIFLGKENLLRKNNKKSHLNKVKQNSHLLSISKKEIVLKADDILIDLGAIAKGYIVDKILMLTKEKFKGDCKSILIDARGDLRISGEKEFKISVENPFNAQLEFSTLKVKEASIVTSGHNKQMFDDGSHILGSKEDVLSLSLYSQSKETYELDALATYLSQLSSEKILEKIELKPYYEDIACLIVLQDSHVLKSIYWRDLEEN